jgi:hypothetical protein
MTDPIKPASDTPVPVLSISTAPSATLANAGAVASPLIADISKFRTVVRTDMNAISTGIGAGVAKVETAWDRAKAYIVVALVSAAISFALGYFVHPK